MKLQSSVFSAPFLKTAYIENVVPLLIEKFNYKNLFLVPKVEKVVVKCGLGDAALSASGVAVVANDLALITGQQPVVMRSTKAIAKYKSREGQPFGVSCSLRGNTMYSFLERLMYLGDFEGVTSNQFHGNGNYSIGFRDQTLVFPQLTYDIQSKPMSMDVHITTTANTDEEARILLALLGMPFKEGTGGVGPAGTLRRKRT